jgi:hypothetical protein
LPARRIVLASVAAEVVVAPSASDEEPVSPPVSVSASSSVSSGPAGSPAFRPSATCFSSRKTSESKENDRHVVDGRIREERTALFARAAGLAKNAGCAGGESEADALTEAGRPDRGHTIGFRHLGVSDADDPSGLSFMKLDGTDAYWPPPGDEKRKLDVHIDIPPHLVQLMILPETRRRPRDGIVICPG